MKYLITCALLLCTLLNVKAQQTPSFEATVKYIDEMIDKYGTDSVNFIAKENGDFSIDGEYYNFFHFKDSDDGAAESKQIILDDECIAIRKDGAQYHVVFFTPQEKILATFRDEEYARKLHKVFVYLRSKCSKAVDEFDRVK